MQRLARLGEIQGGSAGPLYPLSNRKSTAHLAQKVVLAVGNALNGSSFRGNAQGFQLEALVKVYPRVICVSPMAD